MHPGFITLVFVLVGIGALLCAATAMLMAWSLVHPPRMSDGKAAWVLKRLSPLDLGLAFEDARFEVRDEHGKPLNIAAWWIGHPHAEGRCAIIIHGYADAKVGAIAWAPALHAQGFNLLIPDMRGHGQSGKGACSAGFFERHDLGQIIDELRATRPRDARQIVLFGTGMGAAIACAAAGRDDIAAVLMHSPYADFPHAAMADMDRIGAPGRFLQRIALWLAQWLTGADYQAVRPADLISRLPCPVLRIESGEDGFLDDANQAALRAAIGAHSPEHGLAEPHMSLQVRPEI